MNKTAITVEWTTTNQFFWETTLGKQGDSDCASLRGTETELPAAINAALGAVSRSMARREGEVAACKDVVDRILGANVVPFPEPGPYHDNPLPMFRVLD